MKIYIIFLFMAVYLKPYTNIFNVSFTRNKEQTKGSPEIYLNTNKTKSTCLQIKPHGTFYISYVHNIIHSSMINDDWQHAESRKTLLLTDITPEVVILCHWFHYKFHIKPSCQLIAYQCDLQLKNASVIASHCHANGCEKPTSVFMQCISKMQ